MPLFLRISLSRDPNVLVDMDVSNENAGLICYGSSVRKPVPHFDDCCHRYAPHRKTFHKVGLIGTELQR
ncbi:hypothetical protein [Planctomicrobium sp. SH527]|uniref:hypothetical protein n=1 Tax=Planctomicrobium sp. SH527 TaxID=3448123 RepID=UPI003F5BFAE0